MFVHIWMTWCNPVTKDVCTFTRMNLSSMSWTAPLLALSARCVPGEQKRFKLLPETARLVGQVIAQIDCCAARSCKIKPCDIGFGTGMHKAPHQTMCQICSSGFFQINWGQESCNICPENHYCPVSIVSYLTKKNKLANVQWKWMLISTRARMWTPSCVPTMHFVHRAAWPPATAWRLSSVKQGTLVNLRLSPLPF